MAIGTSHEFKKDERSRRTRLNDRVDTVFLAIASKCSLTKAFRAIVIGLESMDSVRHREGILQLAKFVPQQPCSTFSEVPRKTCAFCGYYALFQKAR